MCLQELKMFQLEEKKIYACPETPIHERVEIRRSGEGSAGK